jgi:hypothetical protein
MLFPSQESASRARNILSLTDKDMDAMALSQDCLFAFPAGRQYTPNRLRWAVFSSLPSGATPAAHKGARPASSGYGKPSRGLMFTLFLRHLFVPSLLRPVCPVLCLTKPRLLRHVPSYFKNSTFLQHRYLKNPSRKSSSRPWQVSEFMRQRNSRSSDKLTLDKWTHRREAATGLHLNLKSVKKINFGNC